MMSRNFLILAAMIAGFACSRNEDSTDRADPAPQTEAAIVGQSETKADQTWSDAVAGLDRREGFMTLYVDEKDGRVLAAFPAPDEKGLSLRAIHAAGLSSGLGSNPIGLDRGLFDSGSIIAFRRIGGKLVAEQENWAYRASADNPLEKKAVRESFARSFIWSGDIITEGPGGVLLVDMASFLTLDALDIRGALKANPNGGAFSIAEDRSFPDTENVLAFPDNVEFDAFLTLVSEEPGSEVTATAADGRSITFVQHHSLVRLPDDGFRSRVFDPRAGAIDVAYYDFSAPLDGQVKQAFARRFRLQKQDPAAASSPAKEPIVFYVDSGAPEQVREALIEGASWWADAFAAAGFPDSYRVEVLPEGVHPRDIRYNTILWTHRQTRGWSYGGGVSDPRTGEMIKASVILGSQRVRQDRMIFEGLAGAEKSGTGGADDPVELALARIRQLAAHEVGHTLGFAHNFAASSNDRASVMDYPAPYVKPLENGALDFSTAYSVGVGDWDKLAATWLYAEFPEEANEDAELEKILRDGYGRGLRFVGDTEARSLGTAHPYASVWDNGEDAVAALEETMEVRRIALDHFSAQSIKNGQPIADLRKVIVPIYLYHRYQVAAAAKLVGGFDFNYGVKGDGMPAGQPVADADQRRALAALVETLDPAALALSGTLVNRLTPPLGTFGTLSESGEAFKGDTEPVFDNLAAADSAATLTINALLHADRAARLVDYQSRNDSRLGFDEVLRAIEQKIFARQETPRMRAIAHRIQTRFISTLIELSGGAPASGEAQAAAIGLPSGGGAVAPSAVREIVDNYLKGLRTRLAPGLLGGQSPARAHRDWLVMMIERHLNRPASAGSVAVSGADIPPGSPIGSDMLEECWHCDSTF